MVICGIDEAGRGSLAGPVVAACVILGDQCPIHLLKDSKKLSEQKRLPVFTHIIDTCIVGYAIVDVDTIDKINILQATLKAMSIAYINMNRVADLALVDGDKKPKLPINTEIIVKGDNKITQIMAASIVAKVIRDKYMIDLDKRKPYYGFAKHKGYGTVHHISAIKEYGYSLYHRKSFKLKNI